LTYSRKECSIPSILAEKSLFPPQMKSELYSHDVLPTPRVWLLASRPRTLPASIVPVALGCLLAYHEDAFRAVPAAAVLSAALLIQIGTNFANDVFDFEKGSDNDNRLGPIRATQAGLASVRAMKTAALLSLFCALLIGIYLVFIGGVPVLIIGTLSLFLAFAYTSGPFPIAYLGLGEIFVILFFGPVAVGGTHYILSGRISFAAFVVGVSCGLLSAAILVVNNLRDIVEDRKNNKRTLAARFGTTFSRIEFSSFVVVAGVLPFTSPTTPSATAWCIAGGLFLGISVPVQRLVWTLEGVYLNRALELTVGLLVAFGLCYGVSLCF
jgi:1,4-dihydroxy-2-naphthoate octaprenyltransferase